MHLVVDPERNNLVTDNNYVFQRHHTNQHTQEFLRGNQRSVQTLAAFPTLVYPLFCCQVFVAVTLISKLLSLCKATKRVVLDGVAEQWPW